VTIVAGFKCDEGIVLCADTQETIGGISKRNVPKLRVEPSGIEAAMWPLGSRHNVTMAFCAATNDGAFADELVDRAWKDAKNAESLDEASEVIHRSIRSSYTEFGQIYQPGYCPSAELVYGIVVDGNSKLFYASGPAVNEKEDYATGGVGRYMADFLVSRMFETTLNLRQCAVLGAYILFQTKEHVEGCGGDSHIAILRNKGTSGRLDGHRVQTLTSLLQHSDSEIGKILIRYADVSLSSEEFRKEAVEKLDYLIQMKEGELKSLRDWDSLWEKIAGMTIDKDGLPMLVEDDKDSAG
jgi:20S proteasome alpha/beta subunit